jgi:membrane fusion protein, heavy metal efflux system
VPHFIGEWKALMRTRVLMLRLAPAIIVLVAIVAAWLTRGTWRSGFSSERTVDAVEGADHTHSHNSPERVRISPQARGNLRLIVQPIQRQTYWQTIHVPGTVVERRGKSDRGITAPVTGVVQRIAAVPGDAVKPGQELITLRLTSEPLLSSQTELYKTAEEIRINAAQQKRIQEVAGKGIVPEAKLIDLNYQSERLNAGRRAYRQDLALRGLTPEQIDRVEQGQFLKEIVLRAPGRSPEGLSPFPEASADGTPAPLFEVEELKVQLGEQVQAGQVAVYLADHQQLYIEGRGFREDAALLERSIANGRPVRPVFVGEVDGDWPPLKQELTIQYLANTLDPVSQTFPFYIPLTNQSREYSRQGKSHRIWRFRPGERVRLSVRVREIPGVFVLPADAVVREGAEAYVFRQNGDWFERKPVQVLFEDASHVVLADDGSVHAGAFIAHNGATALNRARKAQSSGDRHGHDHHGHSH